MLKTGLIHSLLLICKRTAQEHYWLELLHDFLWCVLNDVKGMKIDLSTVWLAFVYILVVIMPSHLTDNEFCEGYYQNLNADLHKENNRPCFKSEILENEGVGLS